MSDAKYDPIVQVASRMIAYIVVAAILALASAGLIMAVKLLGRAMGI